MAHRINQVAEMQGLYGPFTLAERVVQKIWLRSDFDGHRAVLTDGRHLRIRATGAWNLLGGPDFRGARVVIDGREIVGDVEVHFHATDWRAHGHESDGAYDKVVLHVVLFPLGEAGKPARRRDGTEMPTLVLLPLLHRDLEEYASDDALETITARDEWRHFEELGTRSGPELRELLAGVARTRWLQKVHFAGRRITRLGWTAAAHQTALEILGYRQNRAAMLTVATRHPLEDWSAGAEPATIFAECGGLWQLSGVRPANHPLRRLQQYGRWSAASPDWPRRLEEFAAGWTANGAEMVPTKLAREALELQECRKRIAEELLAGAVGGTRIDNLICDGLLPLLAARTRKILFGFWFHWYLGDLPAQVRWAMPKLGVADGRLQPLCHGYAQGLLGWLLERQVRASG